MDKCLFPHHKVDEQPSTKPKKGYYSPKKRRESDNKNAVAFVKTVPQLGCVSQDPETLESERGAESPKNPMQKVSGPIRQVRFTQSALRQASIRENEGPSLGKTQLKMPHQRSTHAVKFEDRKRLKDNSDAPEARHGILPKTYTISKKRTKLHSFHQPMSGVCRPHPQ